MHIAHILGSLSPEHGGITKALANYSRYQIKTGHKVSVWTLEGYPGTSAATILEPPIEMHVCRVGLPVRLGRSTELRRMLRDADTPDLYHLHGTWLLAMKYGAVEAMRRKRPYIVELTGTYEPWCLRQKWFQKRVARFWYQDRLLHNAACLHVNSMQEAEHIRMHGFRRPIAVIPVGVDTEEVAEQRLRMPQDAPWIELAGRRYVLYLSRLHPKKRLDLLVRSWARISRDFPEWRLAIAGTGDQSYVDECHRIAEELGISEKCFWTGQVSEEQKSWLYANAHCYVLPTFSENFGNTVAEALAHQTPVITTRQTPWTDLVEHSCGWLIGGTESDLSQTLDEAMRMTAMLRQTMGTNGAELVQNTYSLERVSKEILAVYAWTLGEGPKPECLIC